ncbi:unnamed protein product [Linum trigynum]|uniref:Cytochrome P450 n=1 Tax=Linum trigynum TaxID=586398 RepID=A0AAV2FQQ9_9ROSI
MDYVHAIIAALSTIFCFSYLIMITTISTTRRREKSNAQKNPPEPSNAWPIIGHLRVLAGPQPPHRALGALADKLGPVFSLRIGSHRVVVVSSPEIAKDLFTVNDAAVLSRPALTTAKYMSYNFALSAAGPYGAYWRQMRKIQMVELLSNSRLELHRHLRESVVEESVKGLHRKVVAAGGQGLEVELKSWVGDLSLGLMLRMIVGKQSSSAAARGEYSRFMGAVEEFFRYLGMFVVRDAIPCLGWMDVGGHEKEMKSVAKELDDHLQVWLVQHKRNRVDPGLINSTETREQDFMDVLLSVLDEDSHHGYDRDTVIKATSLSMIVGGIDTTTATVTWAIALLLNHRHVLLKAQEELDRYVSRERAVTEEDIGKLVYLQAIVKESMRLCPVGPLLMPREFTTDCDVGGYRVRKGTWLMVNAWRINTDADVWADPTEFRPERFLTTHKHIDVKGQNFELFPFGSGRRSCPGMNLALQVVLLVLASFLHVFEISTPGDKPVDMRESIGLTNMIAASLDVVVNPRLLSNI